MSIKFLKSNALTILVYDPFGFFVFKPLLLRCPTLRNGPSDSERSDQIMSSDRFMAIAFI